MLTDRSFKVRAGKVLKSLDLYLKNPPYVNPSPQSFGYNLESLVTRYFDVYDDRRRFYTSEFGVTFAERAAGHFVSYLTKGDVVKPALVKPTTDKIKPAPDKVEKTLDSLIEAAKADPTSHKRLKITVPSGRGSDVKPKAKRKVLPAKVESSVTTKTRIKETAKKKPAVGRKPVVTTTVKEAIARTPKVEKVDFSPEKAELNLKKILTDGADVAISFDDTGSMSACRHITRQLTADLSADLLVKFGDKLNVGVIIHGDYCDGPEPVVKLGLGKDWVAIKRFLDAPRRFGGGDAPECYEAALHEAKKFDWRVKSQKILVLIGDEIPHEPNYPGNKARLDWRKEHQDLVDMGVKIISVQALGRRHADKFYATISSKNGGFHLQLTQLNQISDLIQAICYQSCGELDEFEKKIRTVSSGSSPAFKRNLDVLAGRKTEVKAVTGLSDFQMFKIDRDTGIRDFVTGLGLEFKTGCGYYEFMKPETVQDYKKVVVQDRTTEIFYADLEGRKLLRLPEHGAVRINPKNYDSKYRFFIQSTSYTRILKANTTFLYDNRGEATTWRTARDA